MDKNSIIAAKIKQIRTEKNITQKYIADGIGLGENAYSRIEGGYTKLVVDVLFKIADLLETPVEKILGLKNLNIETNNGNIMMTAFDTGTININLTKQEFMEIFDLVKKKEK
jgi:transcriptional regulator with XRE-family HTH domain